MILNHNYTEEYFKKDLKDCETCKQLADDVKEGVSCKLYFLVNKLEFHIKTRGFCEFQVTGIRWANGSKNQNPKISQGFKEPPAPPPPHKKIPGGEIDPE